MSSIPGLLVVIAHPDDEATFAGTLAKYASAGAKVTVVCTTNGGGGVSSNELGALNLAEIRRHELVSACHALGITDVRFLEGLGEGEHLGRHNYATVVEEHTLTIQGLIDQLHPDAVISFGPDGVTGHQTHVMVAELTRRAVEGARHRSRLLCIGFSPSQVEHMLTWLDAQTGTLEAYAEEVRRQPNIGSEVPVLLAVPDDELTFAISVAGFHPARRAALGAHVSQGGGGSILDIFLVNDTEYFRCDDFAPGEGRQNDIFVGLLAQDLIDG